MKTQIPFFLFPLLICFFCQSGIGQSIVIEPTVRGVFQEGDQRDVYLGGAVGYEHFTKSHLSISGNVEYLLGKEMGIVFDVSARVSWVSLSAGLHYWFRGNHFGLSAGIEPTLHTAIINVNLAGVSSETESESDFGVGIPLRYVIGSPDKPFTFGFSLVPGAVFNEAYGGVRLDGGMQVGYRF